MEKTHFSTLLRDEYEQRKKQNPAYSLRSYAKQLAISPASLSLILNRKAGLSTLKARKIAKNLRWSSDEISFFATLVESSCSRNPKKRELATIRLRKFDHHRNQLTQDSFKIVSDWYHFAIVELTHCQGFESNPEWIAKKLEITAEQATEALERLLRLGMLIEKEGHLQANQAFYFVPGHTPSNAMKTFHQQLLEKTQKAITEQSMEERYVGSSVIHLDQKKIPELQKRIKNFRRELSAWAESGSHHDSVYTLTFQSIRLDK